MIKLAYMTIITLWQRGESQREIARAVGCSRDAVRGAIARFKNHGFETPARNSHGSKMDQVIEYLEKDLSAIRIYEELYNIGASVSYLTVSHYVHKIKAKDKSLGKVIMNKRLGTYITQSFLYQDEHLKRLILCKPPTMILQQKTGRIKLIHILNINYFL